MSGLVREPIGLRVLVRALRPEDHEPFLFWRADPWPEAYMLIDAGQVDDRALLWASLLRWREAELVATVLAEEGWGIMLHGVRAIALAHAVDALHPPGENEGWTLTAENLVLRAVPENPSQDEESLERLLAFLDQD